MSTYYDVKHELFTKIAVSDSGNAVSFFAGSSLNGCVCVNQVGDIWFWVYATPDGDPIIADQWTDDEMAQSDIPAIFFHAEGIWLAHAPETVDVVA